MSLEEYKAKRNFNKTPEPEGTMESSPLANRFVIQRHQARRLHYDLRLEIGGTLKSWAVPKGPSLNPADKRLAVRTEDHPMEYLHFEGTIPEGNYGAGEMIIWDTGTYTIDREEIDLPASGQLEKGNLKLLFEGQKIKGKFSLVRTGNKDGKEQWLLIKKKDDFATEMLYDAEAFLPPEIADTLHEEIKPGVVFQPMAAGRSKEVFNDPEWLYELKWDGYRAITHIAAGRVLLHSRNGVVFNHKFPTLAEELKSVDHEVILDGEIVVLDKEGVSRFGELQQYPDTSGTLHYYVFDMLHLNGHSMLSLPLTDRKSLIPEVVMELKITRYCDHLIGMGKTLFEQAVKVGMEGVIAKKMDSTYLIGERAETWLKIKGIEETEALICGYTTSSDKASPFGSLILGKIKKEKLIYIGNCGTGFGEKEKKRLLALFQQFIADENPFGSKIPLKGRKPIWMDPVLKCEVSYSEITSRGLLRNPVYKRLSQETVPVQSSKPQSNPPKRSTAGEVVEIDNLPVAISNLDKIYWPGEGYTKYDLINYYLEVSSYILPYLKDRPQSLHRHPNGITGEAFYQKDYENPPEWMETFKWYSKSSEREVSYLLCQNAASLIFMANLGCIELNPWHSTIAHPDKPGYGIVDLDPPEGTPFSDVIAVAQAFENLFNKGDIPACCKTSGAKGLHLYIPMGGKYTYEEVRSFIQVLCYLVEAKLPKLCTTERSIAKRGGKIYLDALQNRRGQTIASAYSVRPVPGAQVSAPVSWEELPRITPGSFTIENMPARLEEVGDLFKGVLGAGIDMGEKLAVLEAL